MTGWTILSVLDATRAYFEQRGIESARLDAELLIAHALGLSRVMLYARFDQPLSEEERAAIRALVSRRGKREPVAYILGAREFWSTSLHVDPRVLVPRPDTEVLVEVALARLGEAKRVIDVGTGSGAIAIAIAKERPAMEVLACDVSREALALAEENARAAGASVRFAQSDLLASVEGPFDAVLANLPYIPSADLAGLAADVRDFEPRLALDGGPDGLALVRRLVAEARPKLSPGGLIALEAGHDQLDRVAALLTGAGFEEVELRADYGGLPRVASARKPR